MRKTILIVSLLLCFLLAGCGGKADSQSAEAFQKIEVGMFQSYEIDSSGKLWVWGTTVGREKNVPEGAKNEDYPLPEPVVLAENVAAVSSGETFVLILKNDDTLWGCGTYPGSDSEDEIIAEPVKLADNIKSISAEGQRLMAVDGDGKLWDWGRANRVEQDGGVYSLERPVELMDGVSRVFTSDSRAMVLKTDGSLWWWRPSSFEDFITEPVKLMDKVSFAAAGDDVFAAIDSSGKLWRWDSPNADPRLAAENVSFVAVDAVVSHGDVLVYISGGELWADGYTFDTGENADSPVKLLDGAQEAAFCGGTLIALDAKGTLHGWGDNDLLNLAGCDEVHTAQS